MQQPSDTAARKALEATGLLTAEEITLIIGRRKRAASRAAIAASLENTALLPTAEKPAERELTAVERSLRPPPSPGVEKRAAVAEAEDRLSDTLAKMALAPSNAQAPAILEVGTPVSFKLSDGSVRRGVVEKVHNDGAAYTLVEDGSGVRWQHHPARSLKARAAKTPKVAPPPPAADVDAVLSFLTPAQRQRFVDNEVTLECLALLNDEDLDDLLEGDPEAKASFRLRYPPPLTDAARAPVRFDVSDEASPPPAPPAPPTPLPPEAPLPTKIPERPLLRVVVDSCVGNQILGAPRHRRDVVPVAASAT